MTENNDKHATHNARAFLYLKEQPTRKLEHDAVFLVECRKGGEHEEGVNAGAHHEVRRVAHGNGPPQVPHRLGLESAQLIAAHPLRRLVGTRYPHRVKFWDKGHRVAQEEQKTTNQAQALDDHKSILVFAARHEAAVDNVTKVRLEANVDEPKKRQKLVHKSVALWCPQITSDKQILDELEKLHGEKEKETGRKLGVACILVDLGIQSQIDKREAHRWRRGRQ